MSAYPHPHDALGAALRELASPVQAKITESASVPWASITFAGARHRFTLSLEGDGAAAKARALAKSLHCDEFNIRGHLVADIITEPSRVEGKAIVLAVEALTVEAD